MTWAERADSKEKERRLAGCRAGGRGEAGGGAPIKVDGAISFLLLTFGYTGLLFQVL